MNSSECDLYKVGGGLGEGMREKNGESSISIDGYAAILEICDKDDDIVMLEKGNEISVVAYSHRIVRQA